jgi:hypothetical protein
VRATDDPDQVTARLHAGATGLTGICDEDAVTSSLYGRKLEIDLVRTLMHRPEDSAHTGSGRQPVFVLEGGAATGKTALLDTLAKGCAGRVPCAYLDLDSVEAELGNAAIPKLLAALAFQLARRCKLYGSLRFDRLVIGLLAMRLPLDQVDPREARSQVTTMLKNRRGVATLKRVLGDTAQEALHLVPGSFAPSSAIVTTIVDLLFEGLASWAPTRRRVLGRFQDWYGDQDRDLGLDPIGELMSLSGSTGRHNRSDSRDDIDELLWSAFLADLRDNFRTGKHADEWSLNCLLLLDNADTPVGQDFLRRLVQVHEYPLARGLDRQKEIPDPVTVVATSRGGLLTTLTRAERASVRTVTTVEDIRLLARQRTAVRTSWLRHPLPALTLDEVYEMVTRSAPEERNKWNLATMLHQLGAGHPGGTQMLLTAIAGQQSPLAEPEDLLNFTQAGITLEDELYDRLLAGIPEGAIDTVITCSAGRNRTEGLCLLNRGGVPDEAESALFPVGMWDLEPGVPTTLLRMLTRRSRTHQSNWFAVHDKLRRACAEQGDLAGELHHALANGDVDGVVRSLTQRLDKDPLPDWLALLDAVITAPRKPREPSPIDAGNNKQDDADDNTDEANDGSDTEPQVFVHMLVTARWMAADPVWGSHRSAVYWQIAVGYRRLSEHTGHQFEELFELIERYEQLAQQWRPGTHRPGQGARIRI